MAEVFEDISRSNTKRYSKDTMYGNAATGLSDRRNVPHRLEDNVGVAGIQGLSPDDVVFAIDIGTCSVSGVIGVQEKNSFRIIASEVCKHKNRAMMDGQVHDIEAVAATAMKVKKKLEARIGFELNRVAIAAAGRVLKTCQVKVERNLDEGKNINADLISSLEIEGIQRAQMILDENSKNEDKTQFYCVGYSVINYYLNGYVISKLTGHKGKTAGADILATFLPMIVVDSLYSVVNKIGLEVSSMTLEPIAAINVTIPPEHRLLNLALVDIGAGTSDIALTRDGSVFAYAMTSVAGDEITERISQRYLVDFNTGERIKTSLSSHKRKIVFTDIFKKKHTVTADEVIKDIKDSIESLASTITQKILEYNNRSPNAVFLIGGGSRIPLLPQLIAEQLKLPEERVAVKGRTVLRDMIFDDKKLYGPESITPYGIAKTAQMYDSKDFMSVTVNERKIKMFNTRRLTIADALLLYGYSADDLMGRSGKGITFTVNDEVRRVRGGHGKAAEICINGKLSSLDTPIVYGDCITVNKALDGSDAKVLAHELVADYYLGSVTLNEKYVDISTRIIINSNRVTRDTIVNDGDNVVITRIKTLGDLLEAEGYNVSECDVLLNGEANCGLFYVLRDKDQVDCIKVCSRGDVSPKKAESSKGDVSHIFNNTVTEKDKLQSDFRSDLCIKESAAKKDADLSILKVAKNNFDSIEIMVNGEPLFLKDSRTPHMFVEIFKYINFDLSKPQGSMVIRLNGESASFTDEIKQGDIIEIYWDK